MHSNLGKAAQRDQHTPLALGVFNLLRLCHNLVGRASLLGHK